MDSISDLKQTFLRCKMNHNNYKIFLGDSLQVLKTLPDHFIDSMVIDPPSGIGFLRLKWDKNRGSKYNWVKWLKNLMIEAHRVLKHGAYGFVWALPRTSHLTAWALEEAGFEIKDIVSHVFFSGFPKSLNLEIAIDKAKYLHKKDMYRVTGWIRKRTEELGLKQKDLNKVAGVKNLASHWMADSSNSQPHIPTLEMWKKLETVLGKCPEWMECLIKPCREKGKFWKQRKLIGQHKHSAWTLGEQKYLPKELTRSTNPQALQWQGWGTALKPANEHWILIQKPISEHNIASNVLKHKTGGLNIEVSKFGEKKKYPSNFILTKADELKGAFKQKKDLDRYVKTFKPEIPFYYCKRASKKEKKEFNTHPTAKPLNLMSYLCKMITPKNGVILDPFMGSGTTGVSSLKEGFQFIGIEQDKSYFEIAQKRLEGHKNSLPLDKAC